MNLLEKLADNLKEVNDVLILIAGGAFILAVTALVLVAAVTGCIHMVASI